jgi:hypothetical protein
MALPQGNPLSLVPIKISCSGMNQCEEASIVCAQTLSCEYVLGGSGAQPGSKGGHAQGVRCSLPVDHTHLTGLALNNMSVIKKHWENELSKIKVSITSNPSSKPVLNC